MDDDGGEQALTAPQKAIDLARRHKRARTGHHTNSHDGLVPSPCALLQLRREHPAWRRVHVRSCAYLNNIIEQDHRAIKRRCAVMHGLKPYQSACVTIAGIELAHRKVGNVADSDVHKPHKMGGFSGVEEIST